MIVELLTFSRYAWFITIYVNFIVHLSWWIQRYKSCQRHFINILSLLFTS